MYKAPNDFPVIYSKIHLEKAVTVSQHSKQQLPPMNVQGSNKPVSSLSLRALEPPKKRWSARQNADEHKTMKSNDSPRSDQCTIEILESGKAIMNPKTTATTGSVLGQIPKKSNFASAPGNLASAPVTVKGKTEMKKSNTSSYETFLSMYGQGTWGYILGKIEFYPFFYRLCLTPYRDIPALSKRNPKAYADWGHLITVIGFRHPNMDENLLYAAWREVRRAYHKDGSHYSGEIKFLTEFYSLSKEARLKFGKHAQARQARVPEREMPSTTATSSNNPASSAGSGVILPHCTSSQLGPESINNSSTPPQLIAPELSPSSYNAQDRIQSQSFAAPSTSTFSVPSQQSMPVLSAEFSATEPQSYLGRFEQFPIAPIPLRPNPSVPIYQPVIQYHFPIIQPFQYPAEFIQSCYRLAFDTINRHLFGAPNPSTDPTTANIPSSLSRY
ncbi:hypothetical protein QR680_019330 [Steinernema hermaphroditum]|uniref:Uncharacterized protein n=1 Tax=Steinernema hermaphroditum TaxID=289476 RepID=A0AA39LAS3_9BILA|nr:hypothetical protein QR680_019330 [Steinernema hermaphroditum]